MPPDDADSLAPDEYERQRMDRIKAVAESMPKDAWTMEDKPQRRKKRRRWGRPIQCLETGKKYISVSQCRDVTGLCYVSLYRALNTGGKAGGRHYRYLDLPDKEQPTPKAGYNRGVKIGDRVYSSVPKAAKALRLTINRIYQSLARGHLTRRLTVRQTIEWVDGLNREITPNAKYGTKLQKSRPADSGKSSQSGRVRLREDDRVQPA